MSSEASNERLVRVETIANNIQNQLALNSEQIREMERNSVKGLEDVKESTVNLRISVEVLNKTVEQQSQNHAVLVQKVEAHDARLDHLEKNVGVTKARAAAYIAGLTLGLSLLWAMVGGTVTNVGKNLLRNATTVQVKVTQ